MTLPAPTLEHVADLTVFVATPVEAGQAHFTMTASFGVAAVRTDDHTVDQCLGRADTALFAAKRAGREGRRDEPR